MAAGPVNQKLKLPSRPDPELPYCTWCTLEMVRTRRQNSPNKADASSPGMEEFVLPLSPVSVISPEGNLGPEFVLTRIAPSASSMVLIGMTWESILPITRIDTKPVLWNWWSDLVGRQNLKLSGGSYRKHCTTPTITHSSRGFLSPSPSTNSPLRVTFQVHPIFFHRITRILGRRGFIVIFTMRSQCTLPSYHHSKRRKRRKETRINVQLPIQQEHE